MSQNEISTLKSLTNAHRVSGRSTLKNRCERVVVNGSFNKLKKNIKANKCTCQSAIKWTTTRQNNFNNLAKNKNTRDGEDHCCKDENKKAAILDFKESISVAERSKVSRLYVCIVILINIAFVP